MSEISSSSVYSVRVILLKEKCCSGDMVQFNNRILENIEIFSEIEKLCFGCLKFWPTNAQVVLNPNQICKEVLCISSPNWSIFLFHTWMECTHCQIQCLHHRTTFHWEKSYSGEIFHFFIAFHIAATQTKTEWKTLKGMQAVFDNIAASASI